MACIDPKKMAISSTWMMVLLRGSVAGGAGAWAIRTPHQMIDEGDGTYTIFFTGGSTDNFFEGFRTVGMVKVRFIEE
jgi:hypothetical protein